MEARLLLSDEPVKHVGANPLRYLRHFLSLEKETFARRCTREVASDV